MPWLHEQGWPEDRGATVHQLARRQRMALNLLIAGQGRKQIADHMKISVNTVHEYIKDIYDFFGVHSQAELMSRFYEGNGHDRL
ncbi:MAG: LuxR C-terminal-related transcriptional regulator [Verrucomicrobiota bacterium]